MDNSFDKNKDPGSASHMFSKNKRDMIGSAVFCGVVALGTAAASIVMPSLVVGACSLLFGVASVSSIQDYIGSCKIK